LINLDIPKELTIEVTKEDIKEGKRASIYSCPIALAARRALNIKSSYKLSVYNGRVHLEIKGARYLWYLTDPLIDSLVRFDSDREFTALGQHTLPFSMFSYFTYQWNGKSGELLNP
jgi:hypothetical protein